MSNNELLRTQLYKGLQPAIDGDLIAFDRNGHCRGVMKRQGAPHTAEQLGEPLDEIAQRHLHEAKKRPDEFTVLEADEKSASTRKAKESKTEISKVSNSIPLKSDKSSGEIPHVSEVANAKTVIDDSADFAGGDSAIAQEVK